MKVEKKPKKEYCKWQNDILTIMQRKGYEFDCVVNEKCPNPIIYRFKKTKQIPKNRFREFRLTIIVDNYQPTSKWFSAKYRLVLKDYSNNEKGYINNYWGETPWVTAKSFFFEEYTDFKNLIKNIKIQHPY